MTAPTLEDPRWAALAATFPADQIEKLPKPFNKNSEKGACRQPDRNGYACGGFHALPAIHLDYVGHAGVTMRLNSVDPSWGWEAMYRDAPAELMKSAIETGNGDIVRQLIRNSPMRFTDGGLWINLTVLGVTRPGFGDSAGKSGPNAIKELIGDAIRNAAMRFGVGTYLWSKSEAATSMTQREDGVDVEGGGDSPPAQSSSPRQRRGQAQPNRPQSDAAEPTAPAGPSQTAVAAAEKLALSAAREDNVARLQELYRSAGSVLLHTDVSTALSPQQASFVAVPDGKPIELGTWLVACATHVGKSRDSVNSSISLDPAYQEATTS